MYKFESTTDESMFDQFVKNNHGSIMQTSMWAKVKSEWKRDLIIGKDEKGDIVASFLLLQRKVGKIFNIGYVPIGFVCDYSNQGLVDSALKYLKQIASDRNLGITFIDPDVPDQIDEQPIELGAKVSQILKQSGFSRTPKKKPFARPGTTYILDLESSEGNRFALDELVSGFEKGVKSSVRSAPDKGLGYEIYTYEQVKQNPQVFDQFIEIMSQTMGRLGSFTRNKNYFLRLLENIDPYGRLNIVYYDAPFDAKKNQENVDALENLKKQNIAKGQDELNAKINAYNKRIDELKSAGIDISKTPKIYVAGSITSIFGETAVCLFGGSRNLLRNSLRPSHYLNFKRIEDSLSAGCKHHDLARVHLDRRDSSDPNFGLHLFKKSFGSHEVKYIGEFVYVRNWFLYQMFISVLPFIRSLILISKKQKADSNAS